MTDNMRRFEEAMGNEEWDLAEYELETAEPQTDADRAALRAAHIRLQKATAKLPNDY